MFETDNEFYSKPYYFFLRNKGKDYSLYFSSEETLTEARKKDVMVKVPADKVEDVKKYIKSLTKSKNKKSTKDIEMELDELVNTDGSMANSKMPILDPRLHPTKTMDQTVAAARITNDPIARGYRTYYGESVEEVKEEDMSGAFGYEETKQSVRQVLTELGLPEQTQTRCFSILDDKRTQEILSERNVDGIIAGAIYIAAILTESRLPQHRIADVMDLSEVTIRKYYAMLVKMLEIKKKKD